MTCVWREATLFRPDNHVVATKDLSGVSSASVRAVRGRRSGGRYRIVFERSDGSFFRFPVRYKSWETETMSKELSKIKAFLESDAEEYAFYENRRPPDIVETLFVIFLFSLPCGSFILFRSVLRQLFRSLPKEDGGIIRNGSDQ